MTIRKQLLAVAMTGVLAGGGLIATATTAGAAGQGEQTAQSCCGGAKNYTKKVDFHLVPLPSQTPDFFKTTSNCGDINIKPNSSRDVKVCFYKSNGDLNYCQSDYKNTSLATGKYAA